MPDAGALQALESLHMPLYRRFTAHITAGRLQRLERRALAVTTATAVLMCGVVLLQADLLAHPSPFLWPVLAQGAILFAAISAKAFQLWIKRDHFAPWRGIRAVLGLACTTALTGTVGITLGLYEIASTLESTPELASTLVQTWIVRDGALLAASLLIALAGVLGWVMLRQWLAFAEGDQREVLGIDNSTRTRRKDHG